jgi:hypothetical protein
MKVENLRSLIRESINDYIREIDNKGNEAALQAKIDATQEAIELREKKMNMDGLDEAYHDMLDKGKMKELSGEVKALNKSLTKLQNQLNKLKSKSEPKAEVIKDEPVEEGDAMNSMKNAIVPEIELEEARSRKGKDVKKAVKKDEEVLNESFLKMQKLAGVITETQYNQKKSLVENQLNEFDMDQFSLGSTPKASFEDKWNAVPNANKEVLKKSTGKEPIVIMASSKGSNHLVAKGPDSKFYLYTFTQAANPGEPKGPFNSEQDAKKQVK